MVIEVLLREIAAALAKVVGKRGERR